MQAPLFMTTHTDWRPPSLADLPDWSGAKRVAIDIESKDPNLKKLGCGARDPNAFIAGISFAIEDGPAAYLPMRHAGGDNLPVEAVMGYITEQAKRLTGDVVGAHLPYDLDFLAENGVTFPSVRKFRDVQIADPVINELHMSYSLDSIAKRWGFEGKKENVLRGAAVDYGINPKSDMWMLPGRYVGEYAEEDARLPLALLRKQERVIDDENLWGVYDLESELLPVLVKVRRRGVRIDLDHLERVERWALAQEKEQLAEIQRLTGVRLANGSMWAPDVLVPVLSAIGASPSRGKVTKRFPDGTPSIDQALLARIDHPAARAIERARKVSKLNQFGQSVRDHMIGDRIHCTFNQMRKQKDEDDDDGGTSGAAYGRLSCEHPNLQNQPARDDFAAMWRAIYVPDNGHWASCDYSQQEPRMAVHYAALSRGQIGYAAWESAIVARDTYRNDPDADNHQMMADMAGIKRKAAKEIYLGLSYGMGGAKMCRKLGLPTRMVVRAKRGPILDVNSPEGQRALLDGGFRYEAAGIEGQALLDRFDEKVPFIKKMAKACEKRAKEVGYITTLSGRRCHFPQDEAGNYEWTHKGLNRLIQGSAADQTKRAMIECDKAGFDIMLQVHDEIPFDVENQSEAHAAAELMRTCVPLQLPSKVDVEIGKSWGHSMGYAG